MEKYLIVIIMSLSFTSFGQNCSMLKNGKYEMRYDTKDRNSSLIEINGNHYYTFQDNVKKDYEIKTLSNCSFQLENNDKVDESKLTEVQRMLAKQKPYFEIIKVEGNVYHFVCRIDLHVQCGSGKFIRKEE
ncbi:hypothetical protein [Flavobacterium sp. WC2509]|uniref:hypothetical protein n=1 Tax=Flavobacterium sp. WC2509 TaxID=3461406 RepID=UPI0040442BAC